jgi:hypothetical protein
MEKRYAKPGIIDVPPYRRVEINTFLKKFP